MFEWFTADLVGLGVQIFFGITLVLMILDAQKPPLVTSIPTGIALIVLGLGGSFSALVVGVASALNGVLWLVIAWQRYTQKPL